MRVVQEIELGPFLVDLTSGRLLREGVEVGLRPQACRVFKTLMHNRGQYVDYDLMIAEAWSGTVVSRHTVDVTVGEVKRALQEFGSWIDHRPKIGYRLNVPCADDLVRRGWHFWNRRTREGFEKALECFQTAAREDGTDFRAFEGLAATYLMLGTYCLRPARDVYEPFLEAIEHATALAGITPDLRMQRAHALHVLERNFKQSEAEYLKAASEKPNPKLYGFLAMLYTSLGRFDDAMQALTAGYKIDPLFPVLPAVEVSVQFFARNYDAAIECGRKSLELHPYILVGRCYYAQALEYAGQVEEAAREYRTACTVLPGLTWLRALEGACLTKVGRRDEAQRVLAEIKRTRKSDYVDAYYVALLYEALGMRNEAFAELERAVEESSITLCLLDVDPKMDSLRKDPRFASLREHAFEVNAISLSDSSQRLSARA